jgi:hypothetical protein
LDVSRTFPKNDKETYKTANQHHQPSTFFLIPRFITLSHWAYAPPHPVIETYESRHGNVLLTAEEKTMLRDMAGQVGDMEVGEDEVRGLLRWVGV